MEIFFALLALAVILAFAYRLSQNPSGGAKELEARLLNICRNDQEKMERLIRFEQQKDPNLNCQ
ncbi:MAG: hypothetical protein R2880_21910 [Deinococcales bacterium]